MGSINRQITRYELTAVYTHPLAKVDVLLVHGLNGDPEKTWTASNGTYWPVDLLPASLGDLPANVLVYGYNADVYSKQNASSIIEHMSPSKNFLLRHAQTLVTKLSSYRRSEGTSKHPLIWIAHSLGGLLTKRALEYSNDVKVGEHEKLRSVYVSTYAIIFLATPHEGSGLAYWAHVIQAMSEFVIPKKWWHTESILLKTLKRDNETLEHINNHFLNIYQRFKIRMVHEDYQTDLKGSKAYVVDVKSACPQLPGVVYFGIEATHSGVCKFDSVSASGYQTIVNDIREWIVDAPEVIEIRWIVEETERLRQADVEFMERMRPYRHLKDKHKTQLIVPSPPSMLKFTSQFGSSDNSHQHAEPEALFVHPEAFRPNSYAVGRHEEMAQLHRLLQDPERRSQGTSAVLLQCLPGGGKTHLAKEYIFQHRNEYPGGIYWIRAKFILEIEDWLWRLSKIEAVRAFIARQPADPPRDVKSLMALLKAWFTSFNQWLIVFDGILFDEAGVERFIPDTKNTSMIFTSTQSNVSGNPVFNNPHLLKLDLLTASEAQRLLLTELEKKEPWTADDAKGALELVQLMGRLPVMIHTTAQHLKTTQAPLASYVKSYRRRPNVGTIPAFLAVWDQLEFRGATAALSLLSILVYFDQHTPVGLITAGLGVSTKATLYKTSDAAHRCKPTLSATLQILISFALVERLEAEDTCSRSSSNSQRSVDTTKDALDVLRLHSVTQRFVLERLIGQKQHLVWLERAAAVFCDSFDKSIQLIDDDANVGLPDDYRQFTIHGRKILTYLQRYEKKSRGLLSPVMMDVEERLGTLGPRTTRLEYSRQTNEGPQISVFERTNGASETNSTQATSESDSHTERWANSQIDDDGILDQSPIMIDRELVNAHHRDAPSPSQSLMPYELATDDGDDSKVPTAQIGPGQWVHSPGVAVSLDDSKAQNDWESPVSQLTQARGSNWHNVAYSETKINVSYQTAKASVHDRRRVSSSAGGDDPPGESQAEVALNHIRKASSRETQRGNDPVDRYDEGRAIRTSDLRRLIGSATSIASSTLDGSPGSFPIPAPESVASSWTTTTLRKLRDGIMPRHNKSVNGSWMSSTSVGSGVGRRRSDDTASNTSGSFSGSQRSVNMFKVTRSRKSSPSYPPSAFRNKRS